MTTASNGAEIYWESHGEGPVLLLLHGNGEDCGIFRPLVPELAKSFRVILMDSRGHGRSSSGGQLLRLTDMAGDVINVLDAAQARQANILGFSDGGNIALLTVVKHPERVASLVLSGANSYPEGLKMSVMAPMRLRHIFLTLGTLFSPECCREKELMELMLYEPKLSTTDLEQIACPTLITAGEQDMIRPGHTQYLHACIPGSEKHIFSGDHFTPIKQPEEYLQVVSAFLKKHV